MVKIQKRLVNTKRNTAGYVLSNGKTVSVTQAVRMSEDISGVRIGSNQHGHKFLVSTTGRSLTELPEVVANTSHPVVDAAARRRRARRAGQYLAR